MWTTTEIEEKRQNMTCQERFEFDMLRALHTGTYWEPSPAKLSEAIRALSCDRIDMKSICEGCPGDGSHCAGIPDRFADMAIIWSELAGYKGLEAAHILFSVGKPITPAVERFGIEPAIEALMKDCPVEDIVA